MAGKKAKQTEAQTGAEKAQQCNAQQKLFAVEYLVDTNATAAAKRAGYSEDTASEQGYRLFHTPHIRAEINRLLKDKLAGKLLSVDRVLLELCHIAFLDVRGAYDEKGRLKPVSDWPEDLAHAVAGVECDEIFGASDGPGQPRQIDGIAKKLKLAPKDRALEMLAKYYKLLTDKTEVSVTGLGEMLKKAAVRAEKAKDRRPASAAVTKRNTPSRDVTETPAPAPEPKPSSVSDRLKRAKAKASQKAGNP